jgi:hypothetical protein
LSTQTGVIGKMKTFTKKALGAAIAATSLVGAASAVNVNHDGIGEVLIYPYYTVRGGQVTLVSVVNTTDNAKAVKVRFLEGKNTAEVLDFNLFLSARDVWTAAIIATADGAAIVTGDKSCTNPRIPAAGVAFRNGAYVTDTAPLRTLDRTREGYIEMIEMATIVTGSDTEDDVTHVNGVPDCLLVSNAAVDAQTAKKDYIPATGGLFGNGTIVGNNMSTGYNATALEGFGYNQGVTASGSVNPNLGNGSNLFATVVDSNVAGQSRITNAQFKTSIDAVSAVIMHSSALGEYAYGDGLSTDWVITMPTKRQYVQSSPARAPFQRVWNSTTGTACVDVTLRSWDREEGFGLSDDDFSPQPDAGVNQLCWESSVISYGGLTSGASSVLKSVNATGYNAFQTTGVPGGWAEITFGAGTYVPQLVSLPSSQQSTVSSSGISPAVTGTVTFTGLPTIGFSVSAATFANATSNYNSSYSLNFKRNISLIPTGQ